ITGGAVMAWPRGCAQTSFPVCAWSARSIPALHPKTTRSPETAGEELMPNWASYFQRTAPLAVSIAYRKKSSEPKKRVPLATAGELSMPFMVGVFQRISPDVTSMQNTFASPVPTNSHDPPTHTAQYTLHTTSNFN